MSAVGALFVVGAPKDGPQVASKVPIQQSSTQAGFVGPGEREECREGHGSALPGVAVPVSFPREPQS